MTFDIQPSEQYTGLFEIMFKDNTGKEYYLVKTPAGRVLLREKNTWPQPGEYQYA